MALFNKIILLFGMAFLAACSNNKTSSNPQYYTYGDWGSVCVSTYIIEKQALNDTSWIEKSYNKDSFTVFYQDTFTLSKGQLYSYKQQQYLADTLVFAKKDTFLAIINTTRYQGRTFLTPDLRVLDSLDLVRQQRLKDNGLPPNLSTFFLPVKRLYKNNKVLYLYESHVLEAQFVFDPVVGIVAQSVGQANAVNFCKLGYITSLPDSVLQQLPSSN